MLEQALTAFGCPSADDETRKMRILLTGNRLHRRTIGTNLWLSDTAFDLDARPKLDARLTALTSSPATRWMRRASHRQWLGSTRRSIYPFNGIECRRFCRRDRDVACNFAVAAKAAGVGRVLYLADWETDCASAAPSSRQEVISFAVRAAGRRVPRRHHRGVGKCVVRDDMISHGRLPVMIAPSG